MQTIFVTTLSGTNVHALSGIFRRAPESDLCRGDGSNRYTFISADDRRITLRQGWTVQHRLEVVA